MTTADRIRQKRIELGLTQLEVAKRLGLTSKAAVCKVEKQGDDVTLKTVERFSKALGCSIPYLMGWEEDSYVEQTEERLKHFVTLYSQLQDSEKVVVDKLLESLTGGK